MYVPAGRRVRALRRGGLGQAATCPSLEQLMGVTDCSDPCQAASCGGAALMTGPTPSPSAVSATATWTSTPATLQPFSLSNYLQLNPLVAIGLAVVVGALVLGAASGGR